MTPVSKLNGTVHVTRELMDDAPTREAREAMQEVMLLELSKIWGWNPDEPEASAEPVRVIAESVNTDDPNRPPSLRVRLAFAAMSFAMSLGHSPSFRDLVANVVYRRAIAAHEEQTRAHEELSERLFVRYGVRVR